MIPRVFGCVCFVHMHYLENKLSPHALKCVFVGYSKTQKGYKCFHPPHKFYVSADVTFFESSPCFSSNGTSLDGSILETPTPIPVFSPSKSSSPPSASTKLDVSHGVDTSTSTSTDLSVSVPNPPLSRRSASTPVSSTMYPIDQYVSFAYLSPSYHAFTASLSSVYVPLLHAEALAHPGWHVSMEEEMNAIHEQNTWDLTTLPPDKDVVRCHWVFTIKDIPDGSIERLKACLVAKGYTQTTGVDFF